MKQNIISNIISGIVKKINKAFDNPFKKIGLGWWQARLLKNIPQDATTFNLFGSTIHFTNKAEFFHAIEEIFLDEIYKIQLPENALIIDGGANVGMSVLYLKQKHPSAQIIAFEPDETNFALLNKNIKSFNLTNILPYKKAIWKENTTITFVNEGSMSSKIETSSNGASVNVIHIEAIRLKDFLKETVHFLKLDIEGAEYEVLKDCRNDLDKVQNMFIEFHGQFNKTNELTEILTILEDNKFKYYIKEADVVYPTPFKRDSEKRNYDLQLNIFAFRK